MTSEILLNGLALAAALIAIGIGVAVITLYTRSRKKIRESTGVLSIVEQIEHVRVANERIDSTTTLLIVLVLLVVNGNIALLSQLHVMGLDLRDVIVSLTRISIAILLGRKFWMQLRTQQYVLGVEKSRALLILKDPAELKKLMFGREEQLIADEAEERIEREEERIGGVERGESAD